ncbi:MAG TPA: peptidoglycan binding domain-containing protein, partial [Candidatus Saccharimonadia bacterium]|nr:peptidoglycan binding domain-containing protein [Candidatus Saccharimonadia bacterium]
MPKRNLNPAEVQQLEREDVESEPKTRMGSLWHHAPVWLRASGGLLVLALLIGGSFELVYAGKIFPGVSADGVYLGGMSQSEAATHLNDKISVYSGDTIVISAGGSTIDVPINGLSLTYNTSRAVALAADYGRQGSPWNQLHQQLRALLGRHTSFADYSYSDNVLSPDILKLDSDVSTPVEDAGLNFQGSQAQVTAAQSGSRLDLGLLTQLVNDRLAITSDDTVAAPVYHLAPQLGTEPLQAAIGQIANMVTQPITLTYEGNTKVIDQSTLISWMQAGSNPTSSFLQTLNLNDIYPQVPKATLGLNRDAVTALVANVARGIDKPTQNAVLAMQNGQLAVQQASQNGLAVDQSQAVNDIISALSKTGSARTVPLSLQTTTAAVSETNLPSLGITGLISEGETYFPGSPTGRLINVRAGAASFNNALIAPGEVFSIGKQLGEVDASTGYVPELVIDGNHE